MFRFPALCCGLPGALPAFAAAQIKPLPNPIQVLQPGAIYDKGIGVRRSAGEAMKWFTLAADQRDPTSRLNLALFYLKGDGVEKSVPTAELWLKRSANNGGKRAQGSLASGAY
jgi:TPR repeat protein